MNTGAGRIEAMHAPTSPPSPWVCRWSALIRRGGTVLDVACGSGRHVLWLGQQGFQMTALDRDAAALEPLRDIAEVHVADLEGQPWPLPARRFDGVVVTNYLWRPLWPSLLDSLAEGAVLIYETFAEGNQSVGKPSRPDFLLRHGELLDAAHSLRIVAYEDGFLDEPPRFVQRIAAVRLISPSPGTPRHRLCLPRVAGA
jgi:SAM-dependent methyltransferase